MLPANGGNKRAILLKEIPMHLRSFFREQYGCFGHFNAEKESDIMIYINKPQEGREYNIHLSERIAGSEAFCISSILLTPEILDMLSDLSAAEMKFTIQNLINASGTNKQ